MKKIIYRIFIGSSLSLLILIIYLSTIGIKTDYFNSKIISQIKKIEPNIELKLREVSASLDLFNFGIKARTIGTDLIYRDNVLKIETINSYISLKSFFKDEFALTRLSISTKSLAINNLISFIRLFNNNTKLFIAEQLIKNGYIVADLNLEFDELGNIKENYELKGLLKDGQISFLKKYNLNKVDFIFLINKNNFKFNDFKFSLNEKKVFIPDLVVSNIIDKYLITGNLITENINL